MKSFKPNDFGRTLLVEECQRIDVNDLLRKAEEKLKEMLLSAELDALGLSVRLSQSSTRFGGKRYWFECPLCQGRVGVLFHHPSLEKMLGCRKCLGVDYRKHRYGRMVEGG